MSETSDSDRHRLLDLIVTSLSEEPVPDFQDPLLDRPVSATVSLEGAKVWPGLRDVVPRARWPIAGVAVACLAALIVALSSHGPGSGPGAAFAQVQQAVSNTKSMRARTLDYHGDRDPYITSGVSLVGVGSRSEGPNGWESITNLKAGRMMSIDHRARKVRIQQLYFEQRKETSDAGYLEKLRNLPASGAKALGSGEFEGKKVLKFAFECDGEFVVLVDPKTHLPLRMELTIEKALPGGKTFREVTTDFIFDAPADESLFEIKVPPGYAVTRCEEPPDRKPVDTSTWQVSPTKGLGSVPMHATKQRIIAALGTPDLIEETYRGPELFASPGGPAVKGQPEVVRERLNYRSLGFQIDVSSKEGMTGFSCFGRLWGFDSVREFRGKTDQQLGLGTSIDEVLAAYGKPDVRGHLRDDTLKYLHKGWYFLFCDGKLALISVTKPRPENIEFKQTDESGGYTESVKPNKKSGEKKD
jgi:hypothetical protein